jgi:hypothetical protein
MQSITVVMTMGKPVSECHTYFEIAAILSGKRRDASQP